MSSSLYIPLAGDGGASFFLAVVEVVVDDFSELGFVDLVLFFALESDLGLIRSEDLVPVDDLMEFDVELSFLSLGLVRLGEFDLEELVESSSSLDVVLMSLVLFFDELEPPIDLMSLVWSLDDELLGLSSLVWFLEELVLGLIRLASFSDFFFLDDASSSSFEEEEDFFFFFSDTSSSSSVEEMEDFFFFMDDTSFSSSSFDEEKDFFFLGETSSSSTSLLEGEDFFFLSNANA